MQDSPLQDLPVGRYRNKFIASCKSVLPSISGNAKPLFVAYRRVLTTTFLAHNGCLYHTPHVARLISIVTESDESLHLAIFDAWEETLKAITDVRAESMSI